MGEGEEEAPMRRRAYRRRSDLARFFVNGLRFTPIMFISVILAVIVWIVGNVVGWFAR